jgi:hypothetical protein
MTISRSNAVLTAWHRSSSRWDFAAHVDGDGWSLHRQMIAGEQWDVRSDPDVPLHARAVASEVLRRAAGATVDMQHPCTTAHLLELERRLAAIMAEYPLMAWSAIVHTPLHIQPEAM